MEPREHPPGPNDILPFRRDRAADRGAGDSAPLLLRAGQYEARGEPARSSVLLFDGEERYALQVGANSVRLTAQPWRDDELPLLQEGDYLLADLPENRAAHGAGLTLFLELPQGYQEYLLPEGWPGPGQSVPVRVLPEYRDEESLEALVRRGRIPASV